MNQVYVKESEGQEQFMYIVQCTLYNVHVCKAHVFKWNALVQLRPRDKGMHTNDEFFKYNNLKVNMVLKGL